MKYAFYKTESVNFPNVLIGDIVAFDETLHASFAGFEGFRLRSNGLVDTGGELILVLSYSDTNVKYSYPEYDIVTEAKVEYVTTHSTSELLSYMDVANLNGGDAYAWGASIGDVDIMKDHITELSVVNWVKYVYPEDRQRAFTLVKSENVFCDWGVELGDRDVIRDKIVSSGCAFAWALNIPEERAAMKSRIVDQVWIDAWNSAFPDDIIQ